MARLRRAKVAFRHPPLPRHVPLFDILELRDQPALAEVVARTGGESLTGEAILTSEMPALTSFCTQIAEVHVAPETGETLPPVQP